ncbi:hypothetical protein [Streptomyces violascens]|uniref:Uncharacterized protein n=1 Tax=Streptomyces violascens TaxID=67381 RepID=A0ABQ3QSR3_9ACTN|nr:hypothetical protein [Streptomyces violascens]GGU33710.1 hypothetical protein GCM10010289_63750 [Streptomyces violascens]GHI40316.1 hypothetical protein Sviol_47240 [Streptomyces violascens]
MMPSERSSSSEGARRTDAGFAADQFPLQVAEFAEHLGSVLGQLRALDLEGIAPASAFRAAGESPSARQEPTDAAL